MPTLQRTRRRLRPRPRRRREPVHPRVDDRDVPRPSTRSTPPRGPRALLTSATGKIWSNGLDLDWLTANLDQAGPYVDQVQGLFARYLELTVPTVAVLQGHTFAAGALLALANDVRIMRADRGFFCLPEVDISIPFAPGMSALIQSKLSPDTAQEAMLTGRRYGGTRGPGGRHRVRRPPRGRAGPRGHRMGHGRSPARRGRPCGPSAPPCTATSSTSSARAPCSNCPPDRTSPEGVGAAPGHPAAVHMTCACRWMTMRVQEPSGA